MSCAGSHAARSHRARIGVPAVRVPRAGRAASFALNVSVLVALLAASSAPTPLYPLYQERWGLSALAVTVVFSAYAVSQLLALLVTGALSDHLGRRPVLAAALGVEAASMLLLAAAGGAGALITARVLQGAATGAAMSAAGAALLELERPGRPGRAAVANGGAPVAGMAAGVLATTLLARFAPAPTVTVYLAMAALFAAQATALGLATETARRRGGALRSLRPRLTAAPPARRALRLVGAGVVAVWALGGFYASLGPSLVRLLAPGAPDFAGGMVFFAVTAAAGLTVPAVRGSAATATATAGALAVPPSAVLTLAALHGGGLPVLFAGAVLAGIAFGAVSQGALRMAADGLDGEDRAGTLAAYYVISYLAMSLPAIAAGAAAEGYGLRTAAHAYAGAAALLGLAASAALTRRARVRRATGAADGAHT